MSAGGLRGNATASAALEAHETVFRPTSCQIASTSSTFELLRPQLHCAMHRRAAIRRIFTVCFGDPPIESHGCRPNKPTPRTEQSKPEHQTKSPKKQNTEQSFIQHAQSTINLEVYTKARFHHFYMRRAPSTRYQTFSSH
jgi:hypothetical protein